MRRTETDSKGERRKVCLFFLPFVSFDNSDLLLSLSLALSVAVCLPRSCLYRHFLFGLISPQRGSLVVILTPHSL